jgi:ribosomal protein S27AE
MTETPQIAYGEEGPVFERTCPTCGRFVRFPTGMGWKRRFDDSTFDFDKVTCSRCGPFEPIPIGWRGRHD